MKNLNKLSLCFVGLTLLSACSDQAFDFSSSVSNSTSSKAADNDGYYKIGSPYQQNGVWYYPKEDYSYREKGLASWYGKEFHNGITANGEYYNAHGLTAAHRTLPLPSIVRVTNLKNGRYLELRVNDRGPYKNDRIIDVSQYAAQLLGFEEQGTTEVLVEVMPDKSKALKNEMLAKNNKSRTSQFTDTPQAINSPKELDNNQNSQPQELSTPQKLVYDQEPLMINQPPKANKVDTLEEPLIAKPSETLVSKKSDYNDWGEVKGSTENNDLPKAINAPKKANVKKATSNKPNKVAKKNSVQKKTTPKTESTVVLPSGYYIQVGSFGKEGNAEQLRRKISSYGKAVIAPVKVNGKQFYRVRIGPENAKNALEVLDKLNAAGYPEAKLVEEKGSSAGNRLNKAF
ncbi:MAG: septal ring lytic transglycosylase RlpA family protein [Alphaproteobacteria bacterium]|nr:septal ring lytic transglycosylase RlpA family protein [Alphaproteobacteria bacterium]